MGIMRMGFKFQMGMGWDGNGNEVIEMGGNWDKKPIPAHLYIEPAARIDLVFNIVCCRQPTKGLQGGAS